MQGSGFLPMTMILEVHNRASVVFSERAQALFPRFSSVSARSLAPSRIRRVRVRRFRRAGGRGRMDALNALLLLYTIVSRSFFPVEAAATLLKCPG